jgi:UDP-glucuronate decarboxylase
MKILVTGGAGFLGSHLCKYLLNQGHYVIALDNLFTGSRANISDLISNTNFEFIEGDVTNSVDLKVDQIYNLACPASPIQYQKFPVQTMRASVIGAMNLLENVRVHGGRILQASTSEVYGDPQFAIQSENYWGNVNPIGIRACYDEGKRAAEAIFFDYKRQFDVEIKIARIFNTYGPNMHPNDGRVVSNFIMQALRNDDITIYGDGSQTRSFCYVDDLIKGLVLLMNSPGEISGPINLGNPQQNTMLELANEVIKLTGSRSQIRYMTLPEDDPKQRKPDIGLAQAELDWSPEIDLTQGLARTIDYFASGS